MALERYLVRGGLRIGFDDVPEEPPPPPSTTLFGINCEGGGATLVADRLSPGQLNGRLPVVRQYSSGFIPSSSFQFTLAQCPERRVSYSFKFSGAPYDHQGLANGSGNARLRDWLRDIPNGWTVYLTYYHEPNDNFRDWYGWNGVGNRPGLPYTTYKQAHTQFYSVIKAERPALTARGVTVRLTANFMAYNVERVGSPTGANTFWSDEWVPDHDSMDLLTWDTYGNPGEFTSSSGSNRYGGPATGIAYGTTYALPEARFQPMFDITKRLGWERKWGLLEMNTPPRDWDGPLNPDYNPNAPEKNDWYRGRAGGQELGRAQWLDDVPPMVGATPPEIFLFWEHPNGVNWNQTFFTENTWSVARKWMHTSPDGSP
jgi:hypothetical protein